MAWFTAPGCPPSSPRDSGRRRPGSALTRSTTKRLCCFRVSCSSRERYDPPPRWYFYPLFPHTCQARGTASTPPRKPRFRPPPRCWPSKRRPGRSGQTVSLPGGSKPRWCRRSRNFRQVLSMSTDLATRLERVDPRTLRRQPYSCSRPRLGG